tara:strand:+ start:78213 stop:78347 length:135 start_codon:yes stop_codon:yes gene_type:complete
MESLPDRHRHVSIVIEDISILADLLTHDMPVRHSKINRQNTSLD